MAPEALSEGPTTVAPPASPGEPLAPTTPTSSLAPSAPSTAPPSRAASAWHRAALKLTHSGEEGSQGGAGPQVSGWVRDDRWRVQGCCALLRPIRRLSLVSMADAGEDRLRRLAATGLHRLHGHDFSCPQRHPCLRHNNLGCNST